MSTYYALDVDISPGLIIEATDDQSEAERVALVYSTQVGRRTVVVTATAEYVPSPVPGEPPTRSELQTAVKVKRASNA